MEIAVGKCISSITITLQTQKEIDQLYAILNFAPIAEAVYTNDGIWSRVHEVLNKQKSEDYHEWHKKLREMEL